MTTRSANLRRSWARNGPRVRDIVFMVVAAVSALAETLVRRDEGALVWGLVLVVGLAGAAALWWRRQHPVAVTAIGVVVSRSRRCRSPWLSGCSRWRSGAVTASSC